MLKERTRDLLRESGRITPRQVLEAYRETGLRPARGEWGDEHNVCALTALGVAAGFTSDASYKIARAFWESHNLSNAYADGFVAGFDGDPPRFFRRADKRKGYRDGRQAARAVFGEEA